MFPDWFTTTPGRWLLGFIAATVIAGLAHRAHALSRSGALGAIVVGTLLVGAGGWWAGLLLVAFFVTSSTLSLVSKSQHSQAQAQERGSQRDLVQVFANGGVAALCALALALDLGTIWAVALASAIAAANADT